MFVENLTETISLGEKLSKKLNPQSIVLLQGPIGAGKTSFVQGITETPSSQKIVDTTGAGDAFLAGLISKLISSGYPSNELEIEDCIKFAGVCGLLTCLGEGAIEQQPYYEKVNKFLGSLIS